MPKSVFRKPLRRLFRKELRKALREARRGADGPVVHSVRKRLKKVRSWLRLARGVIGKEYGAHDRLLRKAGRKLSAIRESDANLCAFDRLATKPRALLASRRLLERRRKRVAKKGPRRMRDAAVLIRKSIRRIKAIPFEKLNREEIDAGLRHIYQEAETRFKEARQRESTESLHEWRKRMKDLAHLFELFRAGRIGDVSCKRVQTIGELLGEEHDLAVLEEAFAAEPSLIPFIESRRVDLRRQARRAGQQLFRGSASKRTRGSQP